MREKFFLVFDDEPNKRQRINEPINFSEVDFNLDQRENSMGRDVSLSGGKVNFKFTLYRHGKAFDKILYYAHYRGFEANVKLIIVLENGTEFIGELDFVMATTNDFNYFDCPVIMESEMQIFRRRAETKVDMFSSVDIDGNAITPLEPINMLLQAKPSIEESKWSRANNFTKTFVSYGLDSAQLSVVNTIDSSGINNTLVASQDYQETSTNVSVISSYDVFNPLVILEAVENLKNIKIEIKGLSLSTTGGYVNSSLYLATTNGDWGRGNGKTYILEQVKGTDLIVVNKDYKIDIPSLNRGSKVVILVSVFSKITLPGPTPVGTTVISLDLTGGVTAYVESTSYNSITPTFRLIDVMKQIAKSTANLDIYAPRYDVGGEFYDTVLTSGKLLGGNTTSPFYVSWDDLEKSFRPEHNADSEIQIDKRVFVGIERDFYTSDECGFFNNIQFSGMSRKPNPLYCLNSFLFKNKNYQSLKENTEPNSGSTIHGESTFTPFNKKVENSRELSVEWIRDAILLDVQQRLSTKVSDSTATQDDEKIFAIDTIATVDDKLFTESTNLQHTYNTPAIPLVPYLSLRSDGEINFLVLGIRVHTSFTIDYPDKNAGVYNVSFVTNTELQLVKTSGGAISSANDGARLTKYTYQIKQASIPLTNRTNQGFAYVLNLLSEERYSNLRYSVQRNIRNYWNSFLATVNIYHKESPLKNTFYKNNGACQTEYAGLKITEKEDWIPTDPIVTPYMYENVIFANVDFSTFIFLQGQIRTRRGFIRTIDNNGRVLKLYPIKMSYENKTRQLTISGQEKFERTYMTIEKQNGIITINGETKLRKLSYDPVALERDKQVVLFDLGRQKLYNEIYWDKVSINNAIAKTIPELKSWLDLL